MLTKIEFKDLPVACFMSEAAKRLQGEVYYPTDQENKLHFLKIGLHGGRNPETLTGLSLRLESILNTHIDFSAHNQTIVIGKACSGRWIFRLWGECSVHIGDNVTSNGVDVWVNAGGNLTIGDDCMFANCFVHVGDNHAIFDVESDKVLNYSGSPKIVFEKHVWVASRATVLADSVIGAGSIVGAESVVKGEIPPLSLVVGPGRIVRSGVSWTRSGNGNDRDYVRKLLNLDRPPPTGS